MDLIERQRNNICAAEKMKQIEQQGFFAPAAPRSSAEVMLEIAEATEAAGSISTMEDTWNRRLSSFTAYSLFSNSREKR